MEPRSEVHAFAGRVIDENERIEALPIQPPWRSLLIVKGRRPLVRIAVTDATGTAEDVSIVVRRCYAADLSVEGGRWTAVDEPLPSY